MSTGTPVITTGHYPSNSDNSWLVSVNSPMQIANRVIQIYKNPQIAYNKSKRALKEVGHLSWDIVSNDMIKILEKN
jgi:glycosyltransferase involved in cell wall biosynthesis